MKKELLIGPVSQLIDLNNGLPHFTAHFKVESEGPFQAVVVTQGMLDSGQIEYRTASVVDDKYIMSGQVQNDGNQFDNYYVILKAEDDVVAQVEVKTRKLQAKPDFTVPKWVWYTGAIGGVLVLGALLSKGGPKKSVNPSLLDNLMKSVER
jgi:hypothetical protein